MTKQKEVFTINLRKFLPNFVASKRGKLKQLEITEKGDKLILNSRYCRIIPIINRFIRLGEEDIIAIGLYLAEGYKAVNIDNNKVHSGEIIISNSDPYSLKIFCDLLRKMGVKRENFRLMLDININFKNKKNKDTVISYWLDYLRLNKNCLKHKTIRYTGTKNKKTSTSTGKYGCLHISYASVVFRSFFLNFINKIFVDAIKSKDKKRVILILKGFFGGDGHVQFSTKPRRKGIYFCNQNEELLKLLTKSLGLLGINSYFITDPENKRNNGKSIVVTKYSYMKMLFDYGITNLVKYKREKATQLINSYNITNGRFKNNLRV